MKSKNVQLSPPWDTYFKMVYNLLSVDPEIKMPKAIREDDYSFWIESDNSEKIIALSKIMKNEIKMGNITVKISFRCTDDALASVKDSAVITVADYNAAFKGNPNFYKTLTERVPGSCWFYAIFARKIITFYNDDLTDYHGNVHYIVADIAKEVCKESDVRICTEYEEEEN